MKKSEFAGLLNSEFVLQGSARSPATYYAYVGVFAEHVHYVAAELRKRE